MLYGGVNLYKTNERNNKKMKVFDVYVTEGVSINGDGKKNNWKSRTAVCCDFFKGKDGSGEYIRLFKLTPNCAIPDPDDDVRPLFDERGKVEQFVDCSSD